MVTIKLEKLDEFFSFFEEELERKLSKLEKRKIRQFDDFNWGYPSCFPRVIIQENMLNLMLKLQECYLLRKPKIRIRKHIHSRKRMLRPVIKKEEKNASS